MAHDRLERMMAEDWDRRARQNAFFAIASTQWQWEPDAFFESGEIEYRQQISHFLERLGVAPAELTALDLGCGVGRVSLAMARRMKHVVGIDVSAEMVALAARYRDQWFPDLRNVEFRQGDGKTLALLESTSIDFCYSGLVFQHIPSASIVEGYIHEIGRVLRPGGICRFQVSSSPRRAIVEPLRYAAKATAAAIVTRLPGSVGGLKARAANVRRIGNPATWLGSELWPHRLRAALAAAGLRPLGIHGEWTQYTWVEAWRPQ